MNSTVKEIIQAHVAANPVNGLLSYAVDNNPWGVYRAIQRLYPNRFENWDRGIEKADGSKEKLMNFLTERAAESGQPVEFAIAFVKNVPFNPNEDNWTTKPQG